MSKHNQREKALFYLYQTLLREDVNLTMVKEDIKLLDPGYQEVIEVIFSQKDELIDLINDDLKDWTFDRLGFIEQAILLLSCGEVIVMKTPKQIMIDEAIEFAKSFGENDHTYKLINATLDKVLDV